jgi:hypothetical protein
MMAQHQICTDPLYRWVELTLRGAVSITSVLELLKQVRALPNEVLQLPRLVDYRQIDSISFGMTEFTRDLLPGLKRHDALRATNVVSPAAHISSNVMHRMILTQWLAVSPIIYPVRGRLFDDRDSAETWLERIGDKALDPA